MTSLLSTENRFDPLAIGRESECVCEEGSITYLIVHDGSSYCLIAGTVANEFPSELRLQFAIQSVELQGTIMAARQPKQVVSVTLLGASEPVGTTDQQWVAVVFQAVRRIS